MSTLSKLPLFNVKPAEGAGQAVSDPKVFEPVKIVYPLYPEVPAPLM